MRSYWEAIAIIPPGGDALIGKLHEVDLLALKKCCRNQFRKHAPAAVGLMCVDVSYNVKSISGGKNHWQAHVHGIIRNVRPREWEAMRKDPKATIVGRGLFVTEAVNPIGQLAYMSKPNFFRRVDFIDRQGHADTRQEAINVLQELELARWLSQHRAHARFFTIGECE
ncbi:hypothetical protein [Roseinatronobacter monicus]|uniref:Uncharacterized protein n=1 Tax=Roseinatronobacter monicus TaxID=393481 RepID=A0A543KBK3_9RHOB|nr:hypothetical protein [Roseinatronobacter monicus]TQM92436.1 hypothetical protein BD293_1043 [Roseinatronobacter monicus]